MAHSYDLPAAGSYPNLIDISDAEEIYSISDDGTAQKEANDRRLAQAINYLQQEGGDDSPAIFFDRVNRIDETLLNQLPHQGLMFDPKLYRRVRALVIGVRRDFDNAAREESIDMESDNELAQVYEPTAFDEEALYRADSPSPTPTSAPSIRRKSKALTPKRFGSEDNVQRERHFKYGGDSEIENWYKDYPASLPFPETLMMAHWESLKIDYDLNRPIDAATAETIIPLNDPRIQQYFELPQYESGSRFKLPAVSTDDQVAINKLGTKIHLDKVVDKFYERDQTNGGKKDYVPRLFLEKLNVEHQWAPDRLRSELNVSPTKSRTPRVSAAPLQELEKAASSARDKRATQLDTSPAFRRISKEVRRAEKEDALVHPKTFSTRPKPTPPQPATFSTCPSSTNTKVLSHVAIPLKKPRGRPRKNPGPVTAKTAKSAFGPDPNLLKRKLSLGSQPYEMPKSSIKKVLRDTRRRKSVGFMEAPIALEEDSEDPNYPASPVRKPTRESASGSASKAAAAGKLSKMRKGSAGGKMATRSGKAYY